MSRKGILYVALFGLLACALGFPSGPIGQANAQTGGGGFANQQPLQVFSGNYTNSDSHLQISFPANWTGGVFQGRNANVLTIRVLPNGFSQGQGFGGAPYSMTLRIVTKNSTSANATNSMVPFGQPGQGRNFQNRANLTCTNSTPQSQTINGMSGSVVTVQCTSSAFSFQTKSYYFQTPEKTFALSFMARSASDYNAYLPVFDKTANTLQIANTIEAPSIVVPEFPVAIVVIIFAAGIGAASFVLRTKSFPRL